MACYDVLSPNFQNNSAILQGQAVAAAAGGGDIGSGGGGSGRGGGDGRGKAAACITFGAKSCCLSPSGLQCIVLSVLLVLYASLLCICSRTKRFFFFFAHHVLQAIALEALIISSDGELACMSIIALQREQVNDLLLVYHLNLF